MHKKLFSLLLVCVLLGIAGLSQAAQIYLDEDFEGTAAFVDQNWPIRDQTVTPPSLTPKGANLRSYESGAGYLDPRPSYANTGTIVPVRFFKGTKSLQLASGQSVKATGPITQAGIGEGRMFQFALSTNAETAALAAGTQVGHFKFDWSVATTTQVEASLNLNFVVNASGQVDVKCANNSAVIGSLTGARGNWLLISLLTNSRVSDPPHGGTIWRLHDPVTNKFIGPQPLTPKTPVSSMVDADFRTVGAGVQIYVNDTNTTITTVQPNEVGAGWGNNNNGDNNLLNSTEQGWEIAAENGGTIFVDDMYWDIAIHGNATRFMEQEAAGRMNAFDATSAEPQEVIASSKTWDLY